MAAIDPTKKPPPPKPPSEDPPDLGAITQWGFGEDKLWYREATGGAGTASLAVTTRTVNAAYNLSASIFVKKFLALHDRGIKNAINRMAKEVRGKAIDTVSGGTEELWDLSRRLEFKNPQGMLLLRPVALATPPDNPTQILHPENADDPAQRYQGERYLYTVRSHHFDEDGSIDDTGYVRGHSSKKIKTIDEEKRIFTTEGTGRGDTDSMEYASFYTVVKGPVLLVDEPTRIAESYLSSELWDTITKDEWSVGLPERETLQIKGYIAHARDSATFAAIRLDLLGQDILQELVKVHEEAEDAGVTDFDKHALPFEERLHEDNCEGFIRRLDYLAKWITLCIFDRPFENEEEEAPSTTLSTDGRYSAKASKNMGRLEQAEKSKATKAKKGARTTLEGKIEAYASKDFWSRMLQYSDTPGAYKPFEEALADSPFRTREGLFENDRPAKKFYAKWLDDETGTGIRNRFVECVKLHNVRDQMQIEAFPYVLPFVDMSKRFVWGSTATPFLLALTAAASCVAYHANKHDPEEEVEDAAAVPAEEKETGAAKAAREARDQVEAAREELEEAQGDGDDSAIAAAKEALLDREIVAAEAAEAAEREAAEAAEREAAEREAEAAEAARREAEAAEAAEKDQNTQRVPEKPVPKPRGKLYNVSLDGMEASHEWFWQNFAGIHYSNRKALNNGVFAVLFPQSSHFDDHFVYNADVSGKCKKSDETAKILIFVKVHGRYPVSLDSTSMLGSLYSMLEEMMVPDFDSAKRMKDLLFPYCVAVRGPGDDALVTAMMVERYYYATTIMLALESEACQLLTHVARDNRKRKRGSSTVPDLFLKPPGIPNFEVLSDKVGRVENFRTNEFAAALLRLVRAIKSFNDFFNDAGKTTRDRVVLGRIDGERSIAAHEVLYGQWSAV